MIANLQFFKALCSLCGSSDSNSIQDMIITQPRMPTMEDNSLQLELKQSDVMLNLFNSRKNNCGRRNVVSVAQVVHPSVTLKTSFNRSSTVTSTILKQHLTPLSPKQQQN